MKVVFVGRRGARTKTIKCDYCNANIVLEMDNSYTNKTTSGNNVYVAERAVHIDNSQVLGSIVTGSVELPPGSDFVGGDSVKVEIR